MPRKSSPKIPVTPEREVQANVVAIAIGLGYRMERRNTGSFAGEYKGRKRFVRFGTPGDSDLTGQLPWTGQRIDIEVKRFGKKPSAIQVARLRETIANGGIGLWVDSSDLAFAMLTRIKAGDRIEIDPNGDQFYVDGTG